MRRGKRIPPRVELIYDPGCPNVVAAREAMLEGFAIRGAAPSWTEWARGSPDSPDYARGYGSPTVLVDGRDVAGQPPGDGPSSCRLYPDGRGGLRGAPSGAQIAAALGAAGAGVARGWRSSLAVVPGAGIALLPTLACPACWPAYSALLASLGLGFLLDAAYLLPLTAAFLLLAVGALAWRARQRRGYGPFALGAAAALIALFGKFALASDSVLYGGLALLVAASVWNAWPRRREGACAPCTE